MRVPDDEVHTGQSPDFLGSTLGVTACNDNPAVRILTPNSADGRSGIVIGSGSDGASIQDYNRGVCRGDGAREPAVLELPFKSGAVSLSGTTAEVFYEESGHTLW